MADWSGLYLLAEACAYEQWVSSAPLRLDWSGHDLLGEVCGYQQRLSSAPLIPLDFPKKKRSLRRRRRLKVDDDDDDDDEDDFDGKGKGKKKMNKSIMGSDTASASNGVVDHRGKHKENASHQTETAAKLMMEMEMEMELGVPNPNPDPYNLPRCFMDRIQELGGSEVKFVMEKTLSATDLKKVQNRLSMPFNQIQSQFLSAQEEMGLNRMQEDGKHHQGMQVMVIEPCLDQSTLCLKKWDYRSSSFSYVLIKNWYNLAVKNQLEPGMVVQIWSFRANNALCFALVNLSQQGQA